MALLDACLLDRHLSAHEAEALVALAEDLGIDRATVETLHLDYFDQLTKVAWADGVLRPAEMADLVEVGNLLDVPTATIARAFEAPVAEDSLVELVETRPTFSLTQAT